MSRYTPKRRRPGAARGRAEVAESMGLPEAFLRELGDGEMPEDGELMVGDAFGGRWALWGPPADQMKAAMRDSCPTCSSGREHDHGSD